MQNKNKIFYLYNLKKSLSSALNRLSSPRFVKHIGSLLFITTLGKVLILGALFFYPEYTQSAPVITPSLLIEFTNQERVNYNLRALKTNKLLTDAAEKKAQDILLFDYFAHTTPPGKPFYKWIQEADYTYKSAGENLAIAFTKPEDIMSAWMKSPTHRENILDPYYKEIGIDVEIGDFNGEKTIVVVQLFGDPLIEEASKTSPAPQEENTLLETQVQGDSITLSHSTIDTDVKVKTPQSAKNFGVGVNRMRSTLTQINLSLNIALFILTSLFIVLAIKPYYQTILHERTTLHLGRNRDSHNF